MTEFDFDALIRPLGPFERPPVVAAAISGGSDSLVLGLLLAAWVAARGGTLHVLSVDHGLRPEARAECDFVAHRFAALPGCMAHRLHWIGMKPATGLQQAARIARYRLMTEWCRERGVLHLALGHTADDQAETVAMRRDHASSPLGLAAMPAMQPRDGVRLLRPLLAMWRADLRAWLRGRSERWIEDPSNLASKYERVRQRRALAESGEAAALAQDAIRHGQARDAADRAVARFFAAAATWHPEGYMTLPIDAWRAAGAELRRQALRRMLMAVGCHAYPPAPEPLATLAETDPAGVMGTLAGCLVAARRGSLTICREVGDIRDDRAVAPGWTGSWDNRFALSVSPDLARDPAPGGLRLRPLGAAGQRQAARIHGLTLKHHRVPEAARAALPALWQGEQVLAQPHLGLGEGLSARPAPRHCVTTCGFTVALAKPHTMY